jgi:hypothetical protein
VLGALQALAQLVVQVVVQAALVLVALKELLALALPLA